MVAEEVLARILLAASEEGSEDVDPDADERLRADMELEDSETGQLMALTLSPSLRRAYRDALQAHEDDLRGACRRLGAGFTRILSSESIEDTLLTRLAADGLVG